MLQRLDLFLMKTSPHCNCRAISEQQVRALSRGSNSGGVYVYLEVSIGMESEQSTKLLPSCTGMSSNCYSLAATSC